MGYSVKSKFTGLLRGLLRKLDTAEPPRPVTAAAPAAPAPVTAPVRNTTTPASFSTPPASANEIAVPLAPIVAALPMDLRAKLMSVPPADKTVLLPVETVVRQLAFGAVKITFGELRRLAPGIFANSGGELDKRQVSLPLNEILSRLNLTLLARRSAQKVEVAAEIAGPFADRGRGFTFTTQPLKAPAATPPPPPTPAPEPEPEPAKPIAFTPPRQVTPPPVAPPVPPAANGMTTPPLPPRMTLPATNGNGNGNGHSKNLPPGFRLPSPNGGNGHASPTTTPSSSISATPPPPAKPVAPAAPVAPSLPTPPTALRMAPAASIISARLADLSENWPDNLKLEIAQSPLAAASVPLPPEIVEPGLKRGRVTMTWKQLRTLAKTDSAVSVNDALELELPLKIIAPLFLAAKKNSPAAQTKAAVSADIPDLFFGFPQPAPAPVAPAAPAVSATPTIPPFPPATALKPASDTNFFALADKNPPTATEAAAPRRAENPQTDFLSRQTHPKDVVAQAAALPGVAGAVVALPDGLRVASRVPADLNADTLAAFLPQIFDRVNATTRELRMGTLNNLNFTVGNVPWKIFRVNAVFFAAFGRAGEPLPSAQLAQLAAELDRKKQS